MYEGSSERREKMVGKSSEVMKAERASKTWVRGTLKKV